MTESCENAPIEVAVVAAVVGSPRAPLILLTRRHPNGILPDSWELPGGKVDSGESVEAAARRELEEETGLRAGPLEALGTWTAATARPPVRLHAFLAPLDVREPPEVRLDGPVDARWITPAELADWPLPPSNAPITRAIRARLTGREGTDSR